MSFSTRIAVRGYEVDSTGHLHGATYLNYGDHARWELLRAAGISTDDLLRAGLGPVTLNTTVEFLHELHAGDLIDVTCEFIWTGGKTYKVAQELSKQDGTPAARITSTGGLLDLGTRRLVPDPRRRWMEMASHPNQLDPMSRARDGHDPTIASE
jgi:acyl-CoA thioester hydrolase